MFPYKLRTPAWGSLKHLKPQSPELTNTKKRPRNTNANGDEPVAFDAASHLGGDPGDSHTIGGNLQKAILLDLIEFRRRHLKVEEAATSTPTATSTATATAPAAPAASTSATRDEANLFHREEEALGSSFARFKACFREARLGALHTRTIPPRVDKGEYVQLLYSSCFHLLERSFEENRSSSSRRGGGRAVMAETDVDPLHWDGDDSDPNSAFNAIHAAFVLYALHRTNVLPKAPPPRSRTKRAAASGKYDEASLKEAWSMLPIGINSDEGKTRRRTFRSGVRIDRRNYLLLLRLRDLCLARATDADPTLRDDDASRRRRRGLARDAARVVDEMLFDDDFFEYCEYHGPRSLEGLAGSANFYRAHFVAPPDGNAARAAPPVPASSLEPESNATELVDRAPRYPSDTEDLSDLVASHRSNLASVFGKLRKSRLSGGDLKPKQRELVEKTLGGTMERSADYAKMVNELAADDGADTLGSDRSEVQRNDEKGSNALDPDPSEVPHNNHVETKQQLIAFPDTFSSSLCDGIRGALIGFEEEADRIRKAVAEENKVRAKENQLRDGHSDALTELAFLDDLNTVATKQQSQKSLMASSNDVMSAIPSYPRRKRRREFDALSDLRQDKIEDDGMPSDPFNNDDVLSMATGAGRKALLPLPSKDDGTTNDNSLINAYDDFSIATGAGKNALMSLLSMADRKIASELLEADFCSSDDSATSSFEAPILDDDVSAASGAGKKALQFLLMRSSNELEDESSARPVKKTGRRMKARGNMPSQTMSTKTSAPKNNSEAKSSKKKDLYPGSPVRAAQFGAASKKQKKAVSDLKDDDEISMNCSAVTGMSRDDRVASNTLSNDDDASMATGASKKASSRLPSNAGGNDNDNALTNAMEKGDGFSVATGAGKKALMSLLSMADRTIASEFLEDDYISSDESVMNSLKDDDASAASGMGKRALQFLLTQSSYGREDKPEARSIVNMGSKKKMPVKLPFQKTVTKCKGPKNNAKAKSSKNNDLSAESPARATPSVAAAKNQTKDVGNQKADHAYEIPMNSELTADMSGDEELSIAAEGAGKHALASLLSCANKNDGEHV